MAGSPRPSFIPSFVPRLRRHVSRTDTRRGRTRQVDLCRGTPVGRDPVLAGGPRTHDAGTPGPSTETPCAASIPPEAPSAPHLTGSSDDRRSERYQPRNVKELLKRLDKPYPHLALTLDPRSPSSSRGSRLG